MADKKKNPTERKKIDKEAIAALTAIKEKALNTNQTILKNGKDSN